MPPTKFQLQLTVPEQILFQDFQDGHMVAILDIGMERFSNYKFPSHPNASHQV